MKDEICFPESMQNPVYDDSGMHLFISLSPNSKSCDLLPTSETSLCSRNKQGKFTTLALTRKQGERLDLRCLALTPQVSTRHLKSSLLALGH